MSPTPRRPMGVIFLITLLALGTMTSAGPGLAAEPPLVFAKVPSDGDADKLITRYGKLVKALSTALGRSVVFQTRRSYDEMSSAMSRNAFDIVSTGAALYIRHDARYVPVAKPLRFGKTSYRGILLVGSRAKYQKLQDLKGARLGFVSEKSTSGFLLPALMFERAGMSVERDFADTRFYNGKHTAVVHAVTNGEVDLGAVYDDARTNAFGENLAMRARTRILASTPEIPNDPIVVKKSLPAPVQARIKAFFEGLASRPDFHDLVDPLDENIKGWVSANVKEYDVVREWASALERAER